MSNSGLMRRDAIAAAVLWLATFAVFAAGAGRLGFYADDATFLSSLPRLDARGLWHAVRDYLPGRNLHPFWHYCFYKLAGGNPVAHLKALHGMQSAVDGAAVAEFFIVLRLLGIGAPAAAMAGGLFAFWPMHGQTHFWLDPLPMILLSTVFVLLFVMTSIALAKDSGDGGGRQGRWALWAADAAAFLCALFTYDQVLPALLVCIAIRIAAACRWRFAAAHVFYAAAVIFNVRLRLTGGTGPVPRGHGAAERAAILMGNIGATTLRNFTAGGFAGVVRPLYRAVTETDWLLAVAAAAAIAALALWMPAGLGPKLDAKQKARAMCTAAAFYAGAYGVVWLWWPAPRHHYLPSVGLFAAAAVVLQWALDATGRAARTVVVLLVCGATALFAAADRGESHYWERAFSVKRQMFEEMRGQIAASEIVVLEGFPRQYGPAHLINELDAAFAARLFDPSVRQFHAIGSLSGAPAPGGIFLNTNILNGPAAYRYYPTSRYLMLRFTGWDGARLRYDKDPPALPYEIVSCEKTAGDGAFGIGKFEARRDGEALIAAMDLQATVRPYQYLTAIFRARRGGRLPAWGRIDLEGNAESQPILLSDPGPQPAGGRFHWKEVLRLERFPAAHRVVVQFYEGHGGVNHFLGEEEAAIE